MKIDVEKEDLGFTNMVVSRVNQFQSKNGNPLTSVQLVGLKKYTTLPGLLYFGEKKVDDLSTYVGQKVKVLLGVSNQGFNIQELELEKAL